MWKKTLTSNFLILMLSKARGNCGGNQNYPYMLGGDSTLGGASTSTWINISAHATDGRQAACVNFAESSPKVLRQ